MIKKALLALGLLAGMSCGAQVMEKYPGFLLTKISNDGRYLISESAGVSTIYDRQEKKTYRYGSQYVLGLGNAISDNGIVVSSIDNTSKPCYWRDGEWHVLPYDVEQPSIGMANGITPDGKRIVGLMDCRNLTKKAWPMVSPVIWTWDEAKGDYVFDMLPAPEKDITGCVPQQVSATFISADGKTVLGQVTDYRGMLEYQVVYREGADGKWVCEPSGADRVEVKGAVWPEYPEQPVMPRPGDYLTDNEIKAYDNAYTAYLDSLEIVSLTGKQPRLPFPADFLKERKDEYDEDMSVYKEKNDSYLTDLYAFFRAYDANLTKHRFEFNSHRMSANGDFYVSNYIYPDPAPVDPKEVKLFIAPIIYNMKDGGEPRLIENSSMGVYSICNDGLMSVATPRNESYNYSKVSYIVPPGEEPVKYLDWLNDRSPDAYDWLLRNMVYDIEDAGEHMVLPSGVTLLPGTVRLSPDASKIFAYILDPGNNQYTSYFIDLDAEPAGVDSAVEESQLRVFFNAEGNLLNLVGDPLRVDIYDMAGRCVYGANNPLPTISVNDIVGAGVYIVRVSDKTQTVSEKIMVK